jgi:hypothetical protein
VVEIQHVEDRMVRRARLRLMPADQSRGREQADEIAASA